MNLPLAGGREMAQAAEAPKNRLGFALFLLVNATLFIRPAEIIPGLEGLPIYETMIVACILASLSALCSKLTVESLVANPGSLCVLGLLVMVVLSNLAHGRTWEARMGGIAFGKVVIYYFLLIALVDSPARLRAFLLAIVVFCLAITVLALMQWHGVVNIESMAVLRGVGAVDEVTGEGGVVYRLCGPGIFNDPNDLCLMLVIGMGLAAYFIGERCWGPPRFAFLLPIGLFAYALGLTSSRGGFISLLAGVFSLTVSRFGWKRSIPLAAVFLPVILFLFGGRQTSIDISDERDTAQGRVLIWRDGLALLRGAPVFGIGFKQYDEQIGIVAHNSYVHCYVELGVLGGTFFVGAFHLAFATYWRIRTATQTQCGDAVRRMRPFLLALSAAYAAGQFSLSRSYILTTYLVLGLSIAYGALLVKERVGAVEPLTLALAKRLAVVGVGGLLFLHVFVRVFAK